MRERRELARLLVREGGWPAVGAAAVLAAVDAFVPLAMIEAIGALVGRVTGGEGATSPLAVIGVLLVVQQVQAPAAGVVGALIRERIDGALRGRAMAAANRPVGIAHLEDPRLHDRLVLAAGDPNAFWPATPGRAALALIFTASRYVQVVGATLLVARFSLSLGIGLLAATLAARRYTRRWNAYRAGAFRKHLPRFRLAGYTCRLAIEPTGAKEVRLFGLLDWLLPRQAAQWREVSTDMSGHRRHTYLRLAALGAAFAPLIAVVLVAVGRAAARGDLDPQATTVVLQAVVAVAALRHLRGDEYQLEFGMQSLAALHEVEAELAAPGPPRAGAAVAIRPLERNIRFEDVTFRYPGSDRPVLDQLALDIPVGGSLAVVGVNGAGKTTLVKLLARLYEPSAGRITVDGRPIDTLDPVAWRSRLAVIFQDFTRYELSAADNVGFGGLAVRPDHAAVGRAAGGRAPLRLAAERAGARELIEGLPSQWDTPLSRRYPGGVDLSDGEWQRVALARALAAVGAGAEILVLDEPTANLDVRAEAELFDRFLDITAGLTTILISHRFSTVRRARRICVLEAGRVRELGTHDELMAAGGRYAEMFTLQAERFRV